MNVVVTIVVLVFLFVWAAAVYARLVRLRAQVKAAWDKRDSALYGKVASAYNDALAGFPANIIGGMAGFKPAKPFQ